MSRTAKALTQSQVRARVNGLPHAALVAGSVAEWWWLAVEKADELEELLMHRWNPPWNMRLRCPGLER